MSDDCLQKKVICSQVHRVKQNRGGQKLCYKDVLKCAKIDTDTWEQEALTSSWWCKVLHHVGKRVEEKQVFAAHERWLVSAFTCDKCSWPCRPEAGLAAHLWPCRKNLYHRFSVRFLSTLKLMDCQQYVKTSALIQWVSGPQLEQNNPYWTAAGRSLHTSAQVGKHWDSA